MKKYKTIIYPIRANPKTINYLYQCNKENARVWNECIRLEKELWEERQEYINQKYLQDHIKGNFSEIIPAKAMQVTCKKYMSAISGNIKARKQGRMDIRYPWKYKKNYNIIWDVAQLKIDYDKNTIRISRPRTYCYLDENGKKRNNPICLKFKHPLPHNIAQAELVYNNGLYLSVNYWIEQEFKQIESDNICAIDFGEIHSITAIDNIGNSLIITGREIRSIQRFRNKELTRLNREKSKCTKGSNNYNKWRKAINKLMAKSTNKMRDAINKTAKLFVDYVITNNIKTVVVGDLKNFNMNLNKGSKNNQQKLVQWVYGQLLQKIKYNLEPYGVIVKEISEAYTSQTCPNCGERHKPTNRNYICPSCRLEMHRDIVGAYNILSKYINGGHIKKLDIKVKPIKYLRIA